MKIGLVIYGDLETLSGGYLYDRILVDHLRSQGDTVEIISFPPASYGRCLTHNFSKQLYQKLLNGNFDVLLQDELVHPSLWLINRRLRGRVSYPIIGIIHHLRVSELWSPLERLFYKIVEKRFLQTLDGFIFNSRTSLSTVESLLGGSKLGQPKLEDTKPHTIAYPAGDRFNLSCDEAFIEQRALSQGPLRLLFVGNLISRKGLHVLLEALALLAEKNWQLEIVGRSDIDPKYVNALRTRAAELALTNHLIWSSDLSQDELKARFSSSHVLVVPSQYEGFGIVYLEAKAFGLPAIACEAGAAHEIINHGVDGFLTPPEDANTLAQHLKTLVNNRQRLFEMSLAGARRFSQFPSWSQSCAQIRSFLSGLQ